MTADGPAAHVSADAGADVGTQEPGLSHILNSGSHTNTPGDSPTPNGDDRLTLIITTSPTPSAPSTELLEQIIAAFRTHCPDLTRCRVILVLDTYDHVSSTNRLKKGHVTADSARLYAEYKVRAKRLILDVYAGPDVEDEELVKDSAKAEFGCLGILPQHANNAVSLAITRTPDRRVTFVEPAQRLGFGLAVRSALRLTETPYVWVQQHDWALITDIPLGPLLTLMQQHSGPAAAAAAAANTDGEEDDDNNNDDMDAVVDDSSPRTTRVPIKYVCFPSVRMVEYARSDHVMRYTALRALTNLHKQNFSVRVDVPSANVDAAGETSTTKIPLTPLFFWHDKPHVAETAHYLARVFPGRASLPRGAFIEDTIGHRARTEMKDGHWRRWACWLYYPDEGKQLCVRHLKGRTWRGTAAELAKKMEFMRLNEGRPRRRAGEKMAVAGDGTVVADTR
ncbi:hypothetical protein VTJ49DRAFT_408 [Mycothermus thermophilus]|uniref:Uncharacterized protein n=1 Tax=Humicola insolens TaxID=85995 RepID=A0ABR3VF58_HUMIN